MKNNLKNPRLNFEPHRFTYNRDKRNSVLSLIHTDLIWKIRLSSIKPQSFEDAKINYHEAQHSRSKSSISLGLE